MNEYQKVIHQILRYAAVAARKEQRSYVVHGSPSSLRMCGWGFTSSYVGPDSIKVCSNYLDSAENVWEVTAIHDEVTVTQVKRDGAWIGEFSSPVVVADETSKFVPMPRGDLDTRKDKRAVEELADAMQHTLASRIGAILMGTGVPTSKDVVWPAFDPSQWPSRRDTHPSTQESRDFLRAERGEPTLTQADEIRALRAWVRHGSGWFDDPNKGDK